MAYSQDGSPRSGMARSKFADDVHGEKPMKSKKNEAYGTDSGEDQKGASSVHEVVEQHGPAHEVSIHHDHEAKSSHVVSHHGEHKHEESFHGDSHVSDAMDHASAASGKSDDAQDDKSMAKTEEPSDMHGDVASMLA